VDYGQPVPLQIHICAVPESEACPAENRVLSKEDPAWLSSLDLARDGLIESG
jgi:hypothetical protein